MMDQSQRNAARVFGITYLPSLAVIMVAFSRFYAPYVVWGKGEETARHFIGHEGAVRLYLAGAFLYGVGTIVLLTALYVILRPISRGIALFAAFSKLVYVLFWFIVVLDVFGVLRLLGSMGALRSFGPDDLPALAGLQLDSSRDAYYIGLTFNGLGTALFAWVFFRSRYVPRTLAAWGILASLYEGFCGFAYLFYPGFAAILSADWYELPPMTFELLLSLWLLFRGFRASQTVLSAAQG
jgi:xanthine/uracil permease